MGLEGTEGNQRQLGLPGNGKKWLVVEGKATHVCSVTGSGWWQSKLTIVFLKINFCNKS